MDVIQFISLFLYRIRYRMLWGSLIVTALVIYFTQFLPFSYTVNSSIYAGVTNASAVTEESFNFSQSTAHSTISLTLVNPKELWKSLRPPARHLSGSWRRKQRYPLPPCQALPATDKNTPKEVLALVDRESVSKTTENLFKYRKPNQGNFVFTLFSRPTSPFFSYNALSKSSSNVLATAI